MLYKKEKVGVGKSSRKAKLWPRYVRYIEVAKKFVGGERTSDWQLHLDSLDEMLNVFATTGHGNYAQCACFYLEEVCALSQTHPLLHKKFMDCNHSVKRRVKCLRGLWTSLTIEQTYMQDIKPTEGLIPCCGMQGSTRLIWVLSCSASCGCSASVSSISKVFRAELSQRPFHNGNFPKFGKKQSLFLFSNVDFTMTLTILDRFH